MGSLVLLMVLQVIFLKEGKHPLYIFFLLLSPVFLSE
jgi:hypothetical protein